MSFDTYDEDGCCCYHKGTYFQANHNACHSIHTMRMVVVATTKVHIFKQITTKQDFMLMIKKLLLLPQRYIFSLNFASVVIDRVVCHRPINTQIALLIAKALDIAADPLLRLQARDKIIMSKRNHSYMERMDKIRKIAAVL